MIFRIDDPRLNLVGFKEVRKNSQNKDYPDLPHWDRLKPGSENRRRYDLRRTGRANDGDRGQERDPGTQGFIRSFRSRDYRDQEDGRTRDLKDKPGTDPRSIRAFVGPRRMEEHVEFIKMH
ncbi:hypothetical protein NPIL_636081 [Nephila pilipes]|uniref:Uncharacterized protein n=1 Tax=Nephila pilipes TaxID=299642 RepID=A0A8X6P8K4_NEPPI|nr:hypothetical protein NPIL_636081 [Nephila pilipes]